MKPALTTSGKTRTATAFDLHLAAAGFCATSCCRARRESVVKSSADAERVLSNATLASISPAAYFHFDVIFIYVFVSLGCLVVPGGKWLLDCFAESLFIFAVCSGDCSRLRSGRRVKQGQCETDTPIGPITRAVGVIFSADLKADRLLADFQNLADLNNARNGPFRVARGV